MPRTTSTASIADGVQQFLAQRQQHVDALAALDQTLAQIGQVLGQPIHTTSAAPAAKPVRGRRTRGDYATTAEESILAFVKQYGKPTTLDIRQHWTSEGRGGTADNVLTRMVKDKKLKRLRLIGQRGSRYALP